jgi:hypothetical protein
MAKLHTYITKEGLITKTITPMKAIRAKCADCCCWNLAEVGRCEAENCPLWCFRDGSNPKAMKD